eukprot:14553319-Ditylum_brightwellii.AAC.1
MTKPCRQENGTELGVEDVIELCSDDRIRLGINDGIKDYLKLSSDDVIQFGIRDVIKLVSNGSNKQLR